MAEQQTDSMLPNGLTMWDTQSIIIHGNFFCLAGIT